MPLTSAPAQTATPETARPGSIPESLRRHPAGAEAPFSNQATLQKLNPMGRTSQALQRKCACGDEAGPEGECAKCKAKRESQLQRKATGDAAPAIAPSIVHDVLRSPGQPLAADARAFMEPRFGHDFGEVRLHTDAQAAESARAVNALAYTVGNHIVFEQGRFNPDGDEGQKLLAHELVHTLQQGNADVNRPLALAPVDDLYEREAQEAEGGPIKVSLPRSESYLYRQPAHPATTGPTLTYIKQPPIQGKCGDFYWQIKWQLNGATESTNGFIVQKVKFVTLTETCAGKNDDSFDFWWEAWQVKNGKIMSGISDKESLGDEFRVSNTNGSKGSSSMTGSAKFIENYTEPFKWGRLKQAGPLPATDQPPAGWSESGSKYRYIGIQDFDCCEVKSRSSQLVIEELDV